VSSGGGRCVAESTWSVFACFDRDETADTYLDIWLLACGYTPASHQVDRWQDKHTPARLFPQVLAKLLAVLVWPWASAAQSEYQRHWNVDAQAWQQKARHRQNHTGIAVDAQAFITPQLGCTYITAEAGGVRYVLQATSTFQLADIGIPGWETPLHISTSKGNIT
jgi:hypothetical protein